MAIITTGQTFTATDTVTNTKLQDIASAATFDDPADETTLELISSGTNAGKLGIKDDGITPAKLSAGGPTWNTNGTLTTGAIFTTGEGVEVNYWGTGDRNAYVDFWAHGAPADPLTDYDARLIRENGIDGNFILDNKGAGLIIVNQTIAQIEGGHAKSIPTREYVDEYALTYNGSTGTIAFTTSWADWDLSSFVGSNRALVIIELYDASGINQLLLKTKGSQVSGGYVSANVSGWGSSGICLANADQGGTVQVITDENGFVQVQAYSAGTGINFTIQAFQKLLIPTP